MIYNFKLIKVIHITFIDSHLVEVKKYGEIKKTVQ